jgi:hypothetical protein
MVINKAEEGDSNKLGVQGVCRVEEEVAGESERERSLAQGEMV